MKKPKCHQEFPIYHPKKKYFISYLMNLLNDFESKKELNTEKNLSDIRKDSSDHLPMKGRDGLGLVWESGSKWTLLKGESGQPLK